MPGIQEWVSVLPLGRAFGGGVGAGAGESGDWFASQPGSTMQRRPGKGRLLPAPIADWSSRGPFPRCVWNLSTV